MRTHDSNDNPTPQPERFDEMTGGYDDFDHARAAKRLSADLRAMDATPRGKHVLLDVSSVERDDEGCARIIVNTDAAFDSQEAERIAMILESAPDLLEVLQALAPAADAMLCALNERGIENEKAKRGCAAIAKAYAAIARATR